MLAKLSVILVLFAAVSLGQAPDCKVIPRTSALCCMNIMPDNAGEDLRECRDDNKAVAKSVNSSCAVDTCVMKKKNLVNSENKINKAAFAKYLKQQLQAFSPSVMLSLEKCATETETSDCITHAFIECLYNQLMRECPSTLWLQTEECTNLKKFFVDCPNTNIINLTK